jgi:hypothetical protein
MDCGGASGSGAAPSEPASATPPPNAAAPAGALAEAWSPLASQAAGAAALALRSARLSGGAPDAQPHLPEEVLLLIFERCPGAVLLASAAGVCRLWRAIVEAPTQRPWAKAVLRASLGCAACVRVCCVACLCAWSALRGVARCACASARAKRA